MTRDPAHPSPAEPISPREEQKRLEQTRWRNWFLFIGVMGTIVVGLTTAVLILTQVRSEDPWPWRGSETVLLATLVFATVAFTTYLTLQQRALSRIRAELAEAQERELRESKDRFRQLADSIRQVFWIKEAHQHRMVYVSPAFDEIFGRNRTSVLENPRVWAEAILAEDRPRILKTIYGRLALRGYDEEYRIVRPDGSVRWIRDRGFPMKDGRGSITRIAGVAEDITEQKQLKVHLHQSQKMEAVGQLAGGVAHDFNNLLTVIIGRCDLLLRRDLGADPRRDIELIRKTGRRASSLTRQLLAFSRRQIMAPEIIDLNEVVDGMHEMLRRLIGEHISLETRFDPGLGTVKADRGQIEQVIMNLCINARDAMLRGGTLIITTRNDWILAEQSELGVSLDPGPYVVISVTDSGCGMDENTRSRIFEPFFTTKEVGKGTGLGLATVYGIIKQSRGDIHVDSEPRRGTIFRIYLPRTEEAATSSSGTHSIRSDASRGTETVLVVEDQEDIRTLARDILEERGYRVIEAEDAVRAIHLAERHEGPVHLLLADVVLPGINGVQMARSILTMTPGIKVLFMSGFTDNALVQENVLDRNLHFLEKPFFADDLARKVREVLDAESGSGSGPSPGARHGSNDSRIIRFLKDQGILPSVSLGPSRDEVDEEDQAAA